MAGNQNWRARESLEKEKNPKFLDNKSNFFFTHGIFNLTDRGKTDEEG